jgi:hypothetical protein
MQYVLLQMLVDSFICELNMYFTSIMTLQFDIRLKKNISHYIRNDPSLNFLYTVYVYVTICVWDLNISSVCFYKITTLECFVCKLRDVRKLCISRATSSVSSEYLIALKYKSRVIILASPRRPVKPILSDVSVYVGTRSGKYFSIDIPVLRTHIHK